MQILTLHGFIVSSDQQKNMSIVLIVCDYILEDKPNQDMIDTSQASLVFTPDDILNLFQAYDRKILTKVVEKGTGMNPPYQCIHTLISVLYVFKLAKHSYC